MKLKTGLLASAVFLLFGAGVAPATAQVSDSNHKCILTGSYGYSFTGTSFTPLGAAPFTETGFLVADENGGISGKGSLTFFFADFAGNGPLWLLVDETQSGGEVLVNEDAPCTGEVAFLSTAVVVKTSNPLLMPVGSIFYQDSPRSVAFTISGLKDEVVDFISTSPLTIAVGNGRKQGN